MNDKRKTFVRIGCASAFYGDSQIAARQLVDDGNIDYLVFDYLAEATMAILSRARAKDARLGYAVDFVTGAMRDVLADCASRGIKVIANAGGVNVPGCIAALQALADESGFSLTIAGVYGDDLSGIVDRLPADQLTDMEFGNPLPQQPWSINAYLGARPIADALAAGADIVVTGRVVDSALVLGPLMHEFGWDSDDYDRLAQGSLAGHVVECGAQCTGGNFTDWHQVPDFSTISYPIVEVDMDGSFVVGIAHDTGGLVTEATVGEQVLYEIGDPANYLLPDVACDFSNVTLNRCGDNAVRVIGATGRAPGKRYKVCATWADGYRLMGGAFIGGLRAAQKARTSLDAWVRRTQRVFVDRGWDDYRQVSIEIIGAEDTYGPHSRATQTREVMAKFGLHHDSRDALAFAAAEFAYLATSATPGMSGFGAGRAKPQPLMRIHSALVDKTAIPVTVLVGERVVAQKTYRASSSAPAPRARFDNAAIAGAGDDELRRIEVELEQLAFARSGDKGDTANIGVIARRKLYLPVLHEQLTSDAVRKYFSHLVSGEVERFELPGLNAYNFVLYDALGGGGTASVRVDAQGKAYAQMLLSMPIRVPASWGL